MKKIFLAICSLIMVILLVGANVRGSSEGKPHIKKSTGCGYTIVEYGVGIDCNGDTVRLIKSKGFQAIKH